MTQITDGKLRWETRAHQDFVSWVYPGSQQTSDFRMSLEGRKISGAPGGEYVVAFRLENDSYYRFVISDLQIFTVEKYSAGR